MSDDSLDPLLVAAVQQQESGGDPNAVSSKGAVGTMQTLRTTLAKPGYGVMPAQNDSDAERQRVGRDYLQAMHNKYGDKNLALMAYNWGPGSVDNWMANGQNPQAVPAETKDYVQKVNKIHQQLQGGTQTASNQPMEDEQLAQEALKKQQPVAVSSSTQSSPLDEDEQLAKKVLQDQQTKTATQNSEAKDNPTLSEQYGSDVDTARKRITDSIIQNKGGPDPLDVAGAIGSGVSSAIGQTVSHFTPDVVKNALTSTWNGVKGGAQGVANAIDSTGAGQSTGNALMGASNATSNALTSAAQTFPNAARYVGDVGDIAGGIGSVEGVGALAKGGTNLLTSAGKAIINPAPIAADAATIIKGAKDNFGINTPSSLMSTGQNYLQKVASKADTGELTPQINKAVNDIIGANDNKTFPILNQKSYLEAAKNNSAAYDKVFSDIGNVPIDNHIVPILSEMEKIGTPTFDQIGDTIQSKMNPDGTIPASAIKELTKVGKNGKASVLQQLASNATDRPSALAAQNIIDELETALKNKATPEQYARIGDIDTRYKTMKTMEPIARQVGGGSQASIPAIQNALNSSFDKITDTPLPPTQLSNYLNTVNPGNKVEGAFSGLKNGTGASENLLNQSELAGAIATGSPYLAVAPLVQKGAKIAASRAASKIINTDWYKERLLRGAP